MLSLLAELHYKLESWLPNCRDKCGHTNHKLVCAGEEEREDKKS